jgi:hypothetical protein
MDTRQPKQTTSGVPEAVPARTPNPCAGLIQRILAARGWQHGLLDGQGVWKDPNSRYWFREAAAIRRERARMRMEP